MATSDKERAERNRRKPVQPRRLELGKCKQCGKQVVVSMQPGVPKAAYQDEEFCSGDCCRDFHGVPRYTPEPPKTRRPPLYRHKKGESFQ